MRNATVDDIVDAVFIDAEMLKAQGYEDFEFMGMAGRYETVWSKENSTGITVIIIVDNDGIISEYSPVDNQEKLK